MAHDPTGEADLERFVGHLRERRSLVGKLIDAAESVCQKLESPAASVTIFDQENLRKALDAVKTAKFVGGQT